MSKLIPISHILFLALLLHSCASRVQPNGGSKDTKAPVLVKSEPENQAILYKGKKITLYFDEFIELKDGGSGIVVSPPLAVPPEISVKGKSLQIRFKETLDTSTTYSITIGKSVTDITEGNAFPEMGFAFSTGVKIDSMSISGNVKDAFTNKPSKGVLVMLYEQQNDSLPYKKTPRYFARSDEQGNFTIRNIRKSVYLIFSLDDANSNYLYDQPDEKIGFQLNPVVVDTANLVNINFRMTLEKQTRQRLLKNKFDQPGKIVLKYALPIEKFSINSKDGNPLEFFSEFKSGDDSLIVWIPNINSDSLSILCKSTANGIDRTDTLAFSTKQRNKTKTSRNSKIKADTLITFTTNLENGKIRSQDKVRLIPNHPCQIIHPERVFWVVAKDTINVSNVTDSSSNFSFEFTPPKNSESNFRLVCMPGAFRDVYKMENDTTSFSIALLTEDDLGLLDLKITSSVIKDPVILEILDAKNTVTMKQKVTLGESVVIGNISPGIYKARLFLDTNNDGLWTTGKFNTRTQAEVLYYFSSEITIRSGWDLELEWDLDASDKKK